MIVIEYLMEQGMASGVGLAVGTSIGYVIGRAHQKWIQTTAPVQAEDDE